MDNNTHILAVFLSRSLAMRFYDACLNAGISATVINTPRYITSSCSTSIRFSSRSITTARAILQRIDNGGFFGFY